MPKSMEETTAKSTVPMTPMRRFWYKFQVLRPSRSVALGNRHRGALQPAERSNSANLEAALDIPAGSLNAAGVAESLSEESMVLQEGDEGNNGLGAMQLNTPVRQNTSREHAERARVAIQQSDSPFDAVVVTTLPCYPFHCHEDLIKMSRPELVATANLFNSHLPRAMQIEVSETVSDSRVRCAIETLVGIIPKTPRAPKAVRKAHPNNNRFRETRNISPPPSPLAMRVSRRRGPVDTAGSSMVHLERLEEVDESDFFTNQRPLKRRKVSDVQATPTFFERHRMIIDTPVGERTSSHSGSAPMLKYSGLQRDSHPTLEWLSDPTEALQ